MKNKPISNFLNLGLVFRFEEESFFGERFKVSAQTLGEKSLVQELINRKITDPQKNIV